MQYKVIHTLRFLTHIEADNEEDAYEKAKETAVSWDDYLDLQDIEIATMDDKIISKEHINN